jgi:hypothetical protein
MKHFSQDSRPQSQESISRPPDYDRKGSKNVCAVVMQLPITVAARSKARTVFARSDASRSQWPRGLRHELSSLARTPAGRGSRAV